MHYLPLGGPCSCWRHCVQEAATRQQAKLNRSSKITNTHCCPPLDSLHTYRYFVPNPASSSAGCWSWLTGQTAQPGDNITSAQSYTAGAQSSGTKPELAGASGAAGASKGPWQHVHYANSPTAVRRRTNSHPGRAHPISSSGSGFSEASRSSSGGGSSSSAIHVDILVPGSAAGPSGKAAAAAGGGGGGGQCDVPRELQLLKGVSGFAVPGKLMALMGGSGAGEWCHGIRSDGTL